MKGNLIYFNTSRSVDSRPCVHLFNPFEWWKKNRKSLCFYKIFYRMIIIYIYDQNDIYPQGAL